MGIFQLLRRTDCNPFLFLLIFSGLVTQGICAQPATFLDDANRIRTLVLIVTCSAASADENTGTSDFIYYFSPNATCFVNYDKSQRDFFETNPKQLFAFSDYPKHGVEPIDLFLLRPDGQQHFEKGGGWNQLDCHENMQYFDMPDILLATGLNVTKFMEKQSADMRIPLKITPFSADAAVPFHFKKELALLDNSTSTLRLRAIVSSNAGAAGPYESFDLEARGVQTRHATNSDFVTVNGIVFPQKIKVESLGAEPVLYTVRKILVNEAIDPKIFGSSPI